MKIPFKKQAVRTGDLNTPVTFATVTNDDFEPNKKVYSIAYTCFAQVYGPSQKDMQYLASSDSNMGVTIKIRNTQGEFVPNHTMVVAVDNYQYQGKLWNVKDVRPDFKDDKYDVIVLGDPINESLS